MDNTCANIQQDVYVMKTFYILSSFLDIIATELARSLTSEQNWEIGS